MVWLTIDCFCFNCNITKVVCLTSVSRNYFINLATLVCTSHEVWCSSTCDVLIINSYGLVGHILSYIWNIKQLMLTPCNVIPFPVHTGGEVNCSAFMMEGYNPSVPHTRNTALKNNFSLQILRNLFRFYF